VTTKPYASTHWPVVLLVGLLVGMAWGVNARLWMRFISDDPQFTWTGTLFIVIGFGIVGLTQSGALLGRRAGLRRSRLTALRIGTTAGLLPLGLAAGGPMFPTVILAPLALTHVEWSRRTRLFIGLLALVPVLGVGRIVVGDLSVPRAIVGVLWFLVVYAGLVLGACCSLAPQRDGWRAPRPMRMAGAIGLAAAAALEVLMVAGLEA
jgi:hypothetical protein